MSALPQSDARMEFRLPSEWKLEIERAAIVQNRSLTDFATAALRQAALAVLAEQAANEHVQLSSRDREVFLGMLEANPRPNKALLAAAKRHRSRVA